MKRAIWCGMLEQLMQTSLKEILKQAKPDVEMRPAEEPGENEVNNITIIRVKEKHIESYCKTFEVIDFISYLKVRREKEKYRELQKASESSLKFWDNDIDDEV